MNARAHRITVYATLILSLISAGASAEPLPAPISVTDLGTLGGSVSIGYGVNIKGQVVGTSQMLGNTIMHGFFYADGKMTDLGTLGGIQSEARALNDAGQVTGNADLKARGRYHAFLWQQGRMVELGTPKEENSSGLAINNKGEVAGSVYSVRAGFKEACQWSDGKMIRLSLDFLTSSECNAINNHAQIVGVFREPRRTSNHKGSLYIYFSDYAVSWQRGKLSELSPPETEFSLANAINDSGQIAGASSIGQEMLFHACIWQNNKMTDLGSLGSQNTVIYAINARGQIVGGTNPDNLEENEKTLGDITQPQHAFCGSGNKLIDLNDLIDTASGWELIDARSISDTGYVTGTGIHSGQTHAYLLQLPLTF